MIILDTCVLRGLSWENSSTDVLRAIRTAGVESVAVPWMVMEERAAQLAVKYRLRYEATAQALQTLASATPWEQGITLPAMDMERVREHWRKLWSRVVDVVPTSETALREAAFREANRLPPCKDDDRKAGARDAAIWLSAVEYAKAHPGETVYFVSGDKDFGDGKDYPELMAADIRELGDRFVHLIGLGEVIDRFAEKADTEQGVIEAALKTDSVHGTIVRLAHDDTDPWPSTTGSKGFLCTAAGPAHKPLQTVGVGWIAPALSACLSTITDVESYRIGAQVWCMATVRWLITGRALLEHGIGMAAGAFETRILFAPHDDNPRLTVLRSSGLRQLSDAEFDEIDAEFGWAPLDMSTGPDGTPVWRNNLATGVKAIASALAAFNAPLLRDRQVTLGETRAG
ncbi:PIN domain-containing protein [Streptomyces sp. NPDC048514]|uniref:PIN domain-containing protein n=1 Tax=Streptomyces sp. NPDC048514 TaxID=3365564 RepID=UPI003719794B